MQRPIPNHQSSFCWIYLQLLTLSIIRSSCPPSHHWASLGFHFAGLNPISLVGLSGWPGEGRYINWSLGFLRDRFLDPSSSPHTLHHWVPSYRHMASPIIATLMTHSSISLFFFVINIFYLFSHTQHHKTISIQKQNNKTMNVYSLFKKSNQKGEREEKIKKNKSFLYIITYIRGKTLLSINSGRLGPINSRCCTFTSYYLQEAMDPICFSTHVWHKPVLYYCLLRCRKTSKQHSLLY